MNESKPFSKDLPALSAQQAQNLVFQCSDIVLNLTHELMVVDVACSGSISPKLVEGWEGQNLTALVTDDSQPKIEILLDDNSALRATGGKWRHLNFKIDGQEELPLLIKFFRFVHEGTSTNLVCARDLRPLSNAQKQWNNQQSSMQQQYENQLAGLQDQLRVDRLLHNMTKLVGTQPLDDLVSNSLKYIEKICCIEALSRSDGDMEAAAKMLGVTADSLQMKLSKN